MAERPLATLSATVLGSSDPRSLAEFYQTLLGWDLFQDDPGWVRLRPPDGGTGLSFQEEADHVPPVWPPQPGEQQMMMHLDLRVHDLDAAGAHVEAAGARLAEYQPQEGVRVYLDPAGHPFCLFLPGH
jgi:catechol 2,3-dioxygenase-like lactoylglutathione lyase family enzyme